MSSALFWELVKNNNAFLVRRKSGKNLSFSRDPFNNTSNHNYQQCGIVLHFQLFDIHKDLYKTKLLPLVQ